MKILKFLVFISSFLFVACSSEEDPQAFSLTVNEGSGGGRYPAGEVVNIQADAAAENQVFDQWTGDIETIGNVSSASTSITMPSIDISVNYSNTFQTIEGFGFFGARDVWWASDDAEHFYDDAWLEMVIGDLGLSMWRNELYPHVPVTSNTTDNQDAHWEKQKPMAQALKAKADEYNVDLRVILTAWTPPGEFKWKAWGYSWPGDQKSVAQDQKATTGRSVEWRILVNHPAAIVAHSILINTTTLRNGGLMPSKCIKILV